MKSNEPAIECHPWPPFIPEHPVVLMLGTFPPKPEKWSMDFFYPNRINDMWRICGLVFAGDRDRYWDGESRQFRLPEIKVLLESKGIALWDTAMKVRRLRDNASDKFLDIVEPIDLGALLEKYPTITAVVTTGEKATSVVAEQGGAALPAIGAPVTCHVGRNVFTLWRMPSSSRAYPLSLERKAEAYRAMFQALGLLE